MLRGKEKIFLVAEMTITNLWKSTLIRSIISSSKTCGPLRIFKKTMLTEKIRWRKVASLESNLEETRQVKVTLEQKPTNQEIEAKINAIAIEKTLGQAGFPVDFCKLIMDRCLPFLKGMICEVQTYRKSASGNETYFLQPWYQKAMPPIE